MNTLLVRFISVRNPQERQLFLVTLLQSRYFETSRDESHCLLQPLPPAERLTTLDSKPLVVIQAAGQPEKLPRGYSQERWQAQRSAWDAIQHNLLTLSANSRLVMAQKSVHTVQAEEPQVVTDAIQEVLGGHDAGPL